MSELKQGALFTDFYELTMAQLYFREKLHGQKAQFEYFFRSYPDYGGHQAGYCVCAGIEPLVRWLEEVRFGPDDIAFLRTHKSSSGKELFSPDFLDWLNGRALIDSLTLHSINEGRVIHPQEPVIIVRGDLADCQIIESALLNFMNYQTLVATKASRIHEAGAGRPLIEFGMRRAHCGAADAGTRAALIGGADFSSNTGISYRLGIPPKGTHAHSLVQLYMALGMGELEAFEAYARTFPDDCLLLVDTVNTLESGVPNAIRVFEKLKARGHKPAGIRLDSGDLAYLCVRSAQMLDKAGFPETKIVLSNNVDELVLLQIRDQIRLEAPRWGVKAEGVMSRLVFGVGTRLITSRGHCALDGVYKLTAVKDSEEWKPALKISETPEKVITPGEKQVWRLYDESGMATADLICSGQEDPHSFPSPFRIFHPVRSESSREIRPDSLSLMEPLHTPVVVNGRTAVDFPEIAALRRRKEDDLKRLDTGVKRIINPHIYHVSLSQQLWSRKKQLVRSFDHRDRNR
ncbi:MAG: nicotinate phosphoribosyltransferase [Fibrobacterota bacterium]